MANPRNTGKPTEQIQKKQNQQPQKPEKSPSWLLIRGFFSSKLLQPHQHQQEQKQQKPLPLPPPPPPPQQQQQRQEPRKKEKKHHQLQLDLALEETSKKCKKMRCSGSICSNTKVMHRPEATTTTTTTISREAIQRKRAAPSILTSSSSTTGNGSSSSALSSYSSSRRSMKASLSELNGAVNVSSASSSLSNVGYGGTFRGMPFRKLSGCYECKIVVDPVLAITRDPSIRGSICSCPDCGEIFMKAESLELHQAVRHAVSELGPEDTSKNIVEIIFQSSWLKKETPVCKIDRILKVHNTQRTVSKFEEYRDSIKAKATKFPKKHPRCVADGNELLRFYCTALSCSLGLNGSSNLCNSIPNCNICSIIKNGFSKEYSMTKGGINLGQNGILTTATSGKAHDKAAMLEDGNGDKKAMLVCRVIAGRVKKSMEGNLEEYDSVAGDVGVYSNLDELYVFNPKAILPCFVVIYKGF